MTKQELADRLTGREYGNEITKEESKLSKESGLIVVFGYSDDNVEFKGAIDDEVGAYNGKTLSIRRSGVIDRNHSHCECLFCGHAAAIKNSVEIEALWCKEPNYSWTFKTALPHATFEITEDGEPFCRGIVIELKDLP